MTDVRPIDANALIKMMVAENNRHPGTSWEISDIERYVTKLLPPINPDDLRERGRWIINPDGYYPYCSECKEEPKHGEMTKYCSNCGADMRGRQDGD